MSRNAVVLLMFIKFNHKSFCEEKKTTFGTVGTDRKFPLEPSEPGGAAWT